MLQKVIVCVLDQDISFSKDSWLDKTLTEISNIASLREKDGISDSFLFLVNETYQNDNTNEKLLSYGLKNLTINYIDCEYDECPDSISYEVERWLYRHHRSAVIDLVGSGYISDDSDYLENIIWYIGFECDNDNTLGIDTSQYAATLPATHCEKASTWLAILKEAITLYSSNTSEDDNKFALYAACLCEWLHGFEAASENSWNYFEPDIVIENLEIDAYTLACEFDQIKSVGLKDLVSDDYSEIDIGKALKYITEKMRSEMIASLRKFFKSDVVLFCTLYRSIWPEYNESLFNACGSIVSLEPVYYSDIEKAWLFVTEGWHDIADLK